MGRGLMRVQFYRARKGAGETKRRMSVHLIPETPEEGGLVEALAKVSAREDDSFRARGGFYGAGTPVRFVRFGQQKQGAAAWWTLSIEFSETKDPDPE